MGKGQSFLSEEQESPHGKLYRHLNIVISDPDEEGNYLVVPVTTFHEEIRNPYHEQNNSYVLIQGSHPFLDHKSYVCFSRSRNMSYTEIFNGIQKGRLIRKEDITPEILVEIQDAAKKSYFLPEKFLRFCDENNRENKKG